MSDTSGVACVCGRAALAGFAVTAAAAACAAGPAQFHGTYSCQCFSAYPFFCDLPFQRCSIERRFEDAWPPLRRRPRCGLASVDTSNWLYPANAQLDVCVDPAAICAHVKELGSPQTLLVLAYLASPLARQRHPSPCLWLQLATRLGCRWPPQPECSPVGGLYACPDGPSAADGQSATSDCMLSRQRRRPAQQRHHPSNRRPCRHRRRCRRRTPGPPTQDGCRLGQPQPPHPQQSAWQTQS